MKFCRGRVSRLGLAVAVAALGLAGTAQAAMVANPNPKESQTGKVPEWPFLTGVPTQQQLQSLIQMAMQMIQQMIQKMQQEQQQQQQQSNASTYGAVKTSPDGSQPIITRADGVSVDCNIAAYQTCPMYAVGFQNGYDGVALNTSYKSDINYLTGYQEGLRVKTYGTSV
jgi:hypothetical protein